MEDSFGAETGGAQLRTAQSVTKSRTLSLTAGQHSDAMVCGNKGAAAYSPQAREAQGR